MSDPVFVLLKEGIGWLEEQYTWDILGAVVKNYLQPAGDPFPRNTLRFTQGVNEVKLHNFILNKEELQKTDKGFELTNFFEIRAKKQEIEKLHLHGKRIIVKQLRFPGEFWKSMNAAEPDLMATVKDWMAEEKNTFGRPKGEVYWVTGVLICQDVYIAASEEDERELLLREEIPLSTLAELAVQGAVGFPLPIDLSVLPNIAGDKSRVTKNSQCFAAKAKDTYIVGVQLKRVIVSGKKDTKKLVTRDEVPKGLSKSRQLAGSDDEEEEEALEVEDLNDETWNVIIGQDQQPQESDQAASSSQEPNQISTSSQESPK